MTHRDVTNTFGLLALCGLFPAVLGESHIAGIVSAACLLCCGVSHWLEK